MLGDFHLLDLLTQGSTVSVGSVSAGAFLVKYFGRSIEQSKCRFRKGRGVCWRVTRLQGVCLFEVRKLKMCQFAGSKSPMMPDSIAGLKAGAGAKDGCIYLTPYLPVTIRNCQILVHLEIGVSASSILPLFGNREIHTTDLLCALRHLVVV